MKTVLSALVFAAALSGTALAQSAYDNPRFVMSPNGPVSDSLGYEATPRLDRFSTGSIDDGVVVEVRSNKFHTSPRIPPHQM